MCTKNCSCDLVCNSDLKKEKEVEKKKEKEGKRKEMENLNSHNENIDYEILLYSLYWILYLDENKWTHVSIMDK